MSTIPNARPDRISLDYARLRSEGIRHLENIATEIWTDYNAHDPGITTLEVLCYALTDLAYRTNMLPIEDLAATGNDSKPFFLPEEILTCAPVTARDYRKLLIDVRGVKNAWIKVDTDSKVGIKRLLFKHFQTTDPTRGENIGCSKIESSHRCLARKQSRIV